jgi:hypothetical protein
MDRIERGLQGLPIKDQRTAHEALSVLQPYMNRVLGPGCGEAIRRMLSEPKYDIRTSNKNKNKHLTNLTIIISGLSISLLIGFSLLEHLYLFVVVATRSNDSFTAVDLV